MQEEHLDHKEFLRSVLGKMKLIGSRVNKALTNMEKLSKDAEAQKVASAELKALSQEKVLNKRYGTTDAAKLAGISTTALYAAEEDGTLPLPDLKANATRKVRAGYTINQINHIRKVFNRSPSPKLPEGSFAAIVGVLNLKGGSQKTTTVHNLSHYLAIKGYRVLILDTDPQGSLSFFFGKNPDVTVDYEHTMAPYLLEDDEALVEVGLPEGSASTLDYAVQQTYWNNIDIIPACLQNLNIDLTMQHVVKTSGMSQLDAMMKLRTGLLGLSDNYDFILLDGTPSLNLTTVNVISACDMCFVPTPAAMSDFASTGKFISLIEQTIEMFDEEEIYPNLPDVRFFITKFSKSSYSKYMARFIRKIFEVEEGDVLQCIAEHSDEVGKAANKMLSVYEVNQGDADNPRKLKATIQMYDELFSEILDAVIEHCFDGESRDVSSDHQLAKLQERKERWDEAVSIVSEEKPS